MSIQKFLFPFLVLPLLTSCHLDLSPPVPYGPPIELQVRQSAINLCGEVTWQASLKKDGVDVSDRYKFLRHIASYTDDDYFDRIPKLSFSKTDLHMLYWLSPQREFMVDKGEVLTSWPISLGVQIQCKDQIFTKEINLRNQNDSYVVFLISAKDDKLVVEYRLVTD